MPTAAKDRAAEQRQQAEAEGKRLSEHYFLAFAAPPAGDTSVSDWFPALHAGGHIYAGREIKITEADLDQAVENFERNWKPRGGVPVDYDHSFAEGGSSVAAGWIVEMERRGDTLYEKVEWTGRAAEQIANGEYKFYSAEFTDEWMNETGDNEGFTILAGALTNRPFLRGLAPVALSQKVVEAVGEWTIAHADRLVPGEPKRRDETRPDVPKENTDTQTFTVEIDGKDQAVEKFTVEIDGETKELTVAEVTAMHQAKATADKAAEEAAAAQRKAEGENTTLSQRVDKLGTDLDVERFSRRFDQRKREGAVDAKPETFTMWTERVEKFGLEEATSLLDELPADTIPVTDRGLEGGTPAGETPVDGDVPEGTDPEMFHLDQRAQTILEEKPDLEGGYRAALSQARKERASQKQGAAA